MTKEEYLAAEHAHDEKARALRDELEALKAEYIESCAIPAGTRVSVNSKYGGKDYTGVVASRSVVDSGDIEYEVFQDKADGSPGARRRNPPYFDSVRPLEEKP